MTIPILLSLFASATHAAPLTLERFIESASEAHEGLHAARKAAEGADSRASEGRLLYSPALFAEAKRQTDARKNSNPAFMGTRTERSAYSLGVETRLPVGASLRAAYDVLNQDTTGAQAAFLPMPRNSEASPSLTATLSLWRNLFGGEIRAQKEALEASALSASWAERAKAEALLAEAELAYWRLALARSIEKITREMLSRTEEMAAWARRRAKLHLSDESDLLQTEAAVELRRYEVRAAEDEARSAERLFQAFLGRRSGETAPELSPFPADFASRPLPAKSALSSRLRSAEYGMKAATASHRVAREQAKPTVELFGAYARQSLEIERSDAVSRAFEPDYYQSMVGVRLTAPLDLLGAARAQAGRSLEAEAAEAGYRRLRFDADVQWSDLAERWKAAKEKLAITDRLTQLQRRKLARERERLSKGRSTTFQILQFHQDLLQAELSKNRLQLELASLRAQLQLFQGDAP